MIVTSRRLTVETHGRGFLEVTESVQQLLAETRATNGVAHVFVRHTSCGVTITENADPEVRRDLETLARRWAPDGDPEYHHALEGRDDMAAHARSVISGSSVSVPFDGGRLLLGTWQGIYLWEHRTAPQRRELVVTLMGLAEPQGH